MAYEWTDLYRLHGAVTAALRADRVDLVWLNRAEPILVFEVVWGGRVLLSRNDETLNDFELKAKKRYYDYRFYLERRRRERVVGLKETLIKRIGKLREYGRDLKDTAPMSFDDYCRDRRTRRPSSGSCF